MKIALIRGHPDAARDHFGHALAGAYAEAAADAAHEVKKFCGVSPVRTSLVGTVEGTSRRAHELWLAKMGTFGRAGTWNRLMQGLHERIVEQSAILRARHPAVGFDAIHSLLRTADSNRSTPRTDPAVPFGGKHRVIDFTLSS